MEKLGSSLKVSDEGFSLWGPPAGDTLLILLLVKLQLAVVNFCTTVSEVIFK